MLDQIYNTNLNSSVPSHGETSHSRDLYARLAGQGGKYKIEFPK